ncbi:hypothetical protein BGW80DRAFT_1562167 [Lactifluus volemus]|nr:hypothetical protein BGW80DRAFT_1562167 [Lactifluus volemus]
MLLLGPYRHPRTRPLSPLNFVSTPALNIDPIGTSRLYQPDVALSRKTNIHLDHRLRRVLS